MQKTHQLNNGGSKEKMKTGITENSESVKLNIISSKGRQMLFLPHASINFDQTHDAAVIGSNIPMQGSQNSIKQDK